MVREPTQTVCLGKRFSCRWPGCLKVKAFPPGGAGDICASSNTVCGPVLTSPPASEYTVKIIPKGHGKVLGPRMSILCHINPNCWHTEDFTTGRGKKGKGWNGTAEVRLTFVRLGSGKDGKYLQDHKGIHAINSRTLTMRSQS